MFNNARYITKGVNAEIPLGIQCLLWLAIDSMEVETKDYLQVFHISARSGKQHIIHTQEEPNFRSECDILVSRDETLVTASLFVIDDGDHTTMLLSSEY